VHNSRHRSHSRGCTSTSGHVGVGPLRPSAGSVDHPALSSLRLRLSAFGSGGGPEVARAPPLVMIITSRHRVARQRRLSIALNRIMRAVETLENPWSRYRENAPTAHLPGC